MRNGFIYAIIGLFVGLALSDLASAAPINSDVSIDLPVTREDGAPLPASEIAGYRIYFTVDQPISTALDAPFITLVSGLTKSFSVDLAPRVQPYTIRVAVRTVDRDGRISAILSPIASKSFVVKSTASPSASSAVRFNLTCSPSCSLSVVE